MDDTNNGSEGTVKGSILPTEGISAGSASGQQIGPYRLLEKLGEGGMGEVWLAEQDKPVRRKVALKVIKKGMDTKQVVARFEAERQALALMDHPAIAKVYDAGATSRGRPYFAMEHVKGVPITEYCDRNKLTNRERLDLFVQVCEGVQHAHQKAVIHRDLKPGNVLVSVQNDKPAPKIIDFGVAKATAQKLTQQTMHTQLGVMIGTPAYMSPEQAEMTGLDVDTRTDVYSLGVVLYELIVGALPFDMKEFLHAGHEGVVRKIREDEPPKPSNRLASLGDGSTQSAERRRTELPALKRELSGDLDWITMKALEKDRTRRYASPGDLAADLERHLKDEPVLAGPPSRRYRLGKFVRRNRLGVVTGVAILAAALAGVGMMTYGLVRATRAETAAKEEAATATAVSDFLAGLFAESNPFGRGGAALTAREILDRGSAGIEEQLAGQPRVQARMLHVMGTSYQSLGLFEEARPLLEKALDSAIAVHGESHRAVFGIKSALGRVEHRLGGYDRAESLLLAALAGYRDLLGEFHLSTAWVMGDLGYQYSMHGRYDDADPLLTGALEIRSAELGVRHAATLGTMETLGHLRRRQGRLDEAESLNIESLEGRRELFGVEHPATQDSMNGLGLVYSAQERFEEAEALFSECLRLQRRSLGNDHLITAYTIGNLGALYASQARFDEARPLLEESLEIRNSSLGADTVDTFEAANSLAVLYVNQAQYVRATELLEDLLERSRRVLGNEHRRTASTLNNLAIAHYYQGQLGDATRAFEGAFDIEQKLYGLEHPSVLMSAGNLAAIYLAGGRIDEGEALLEETLEILRRVSGVENNMTRYAMSNLAVLHAERARYEDAERLLEEALAAQRVNMDEDHPDTLSMVGRLAAVYVEQGRVEEAEEMHSRNLDAQTRMFGAEHPDTLFSMEGLAHVYVHQARFDEAEALLEKALAISKRRLGEDHETTLGILYTEARLEMARGSTERALALLRDAIGTSSVARTVPHDPHFESLRGSREFDAIVAEVER